MMGMIESRRRRGWQRMRWLDGWHHRLDGHEFEQGLEACDGQECAAVHGVTKSRTGLIYWTVSSVDCYFKQIQLIFVCWPFALWHTYYRWQLLLDSLRFSAYKIMSSADRNSLVFPFQNKCLSFHSPWFYWQESPVQVWKWAVRRDILVLFLILGREQIFEISFIKLNKLSFY